MNDTHGAGGSGNTGYGYKLNTIFVMAYTHIYTCILMFNGHV